MSHRAPHGLVARGAPHTDEGLRTDASLARFSTGGPGRAKCRCGTLSEPLSGYMARQRWHRDHLDHVAVAEIEARSYA